MSELDEKFEQAQQAVVDKFKAKLKDVCEDVFSAFYTDVVNYATSDAHTNYHNYLKDVFRESLTKEISEEYGHYSWAHGIRMKLLEMYPDKLRNKIIEDLQERIKSQDEHIEQLRRRY